MKTRCPKPALEQQVLRTGSADGGFELVLLKRVANPQHGPALQHLRAGKAGRSWAFWEEAGYGSDLAMALPFAPGHLISKRGQEEGGEWFPGWKQ